MYLNLKILRLASVCKLNAFRGRLRGDIGAIFRFRHINTDAQKEIRATSSENPFILIFIDFYEKGLLLETSYVAEKCVPFIIGHTMEQSGERFNIRAM
jgi:hypothetical protein